MPHHRRGAAGVSHKGGGAARDFRRTESAPRAEPKGASGSGQGRDSGSMELPFWGAGWHLLYETDWLGRV